MDPNITATRKRNLDQLYASIRALAPDLYTRAVAIASITFPSDTEKAAALEAHIMALISDTIRRRQ